MRSRVIFVSGKSRPEQDCAALSRGDQACQTSPLSLINKENRKDLVVSGQNPRLWINDLSSVYPEVSNPV